VRKELGFLYAGYRFRAYYWEALVMLRKMLMIFVATFVATQGKLYQALLVQAVVAAFLLAHCWKLPFLDMPFNWLEGLSLGATFATMFAGYFFLAGEESGSESTTSQNDFTLPEAAEVLFFLLILGFQIAFAVVGFIIDV
jgi:hypothetical protein